MRVNLIDKDEVVDAIRNELHVEVPLNQNNKFDAEVYKLTERAIYVTTKTILSIIESMPVKQYYLCSDCALYNKDYGDIYG